MHEQTHRNRRRTRATPPPRRRAPGPPRVAQHRRPHLGRGSRLSAISLSPRRRLPGLYFELLPDNTNVTAAHIVAFLRAVKAMLPRFTVVWDRSRTHSRSRLVGAFLAAHRSVRVEDFPGYAPELNPDEGVWGYTKYGRLANFAPADTQALRERVTAELNELKQYPYSLYSFIEHTNLPLQL